MTDQIANGELKQIQISIAKLEERLDGWMRNTDEYRKGRDKVFDQINAILAKLPCAERAWQGEQIKSLWGCFGGLSFLVIGAFILHLFGKV